MGKIINYLTIRQILSTSLFFCAIYIVSYFNRVLKLPSQYRDFCCSDDKILNLFFIFIPILFFSILISVFKLEALFVWKKYTFYFLILYAVFYFLMPKNSDAFLWFQRETLVFFGSILYSLISIILIIFKSIQLRSRG